MLLSVLTSAAKYAGVLNRRQEFGSPVLYDTLIKGSQTVPNVSVRECVRACVRVTLCAYVCLCVCVCERVCVCVWCMYMRVWGCFVCLRFVLYCVFIDFTYITMYRMYENFTNSPQTRHSTFSATQNLYRQTIHINELRLRKCGLTTLETRGLRGDQIDRSV